MARTRNIAEMAVNASRCDSCPFNENGCREIRHKVESRCLSEASQICHGTDNKTLCRGARDHQLQFFHRLGLLKEPTDACWDKLRKEMGI